jgi:hypothetical protein
VWSIRYVSQIYVEIGHVFMSRGDAASAMSNYREALAAASRVLSRAPTSLYLQRDRAEVLEVLGRYFLRRSAQPDLAKVDRVRLQGEARTYLQQSLATWSNWTSRKIASPYAERRASAALAVLAAIGRT